MLILAVDTSGRKGSVALCRGDVHDFEVLQLKSLEGGMYSAQLLPQIAAALTESNLSKSQLEGFVVVSGPGSFTGLRVGLATLKGLCEILQKPLAALSMLEALALTYGRSGETVTALLDAGREEVYVGEYNLSDAAATLVREHTVKLHEFVTQSRVMHGHLLTPDATVADALHAQRIAFELVSRLHADHIGRLGFRKLLAGDTVDPATIDVNYIRRSDAEIFSAPQP